MTKHASLTSSKRKLMKKINGCSGVYVLQILFMIKECRSSYKKRKGNILTMSHFWNFKVLISLRNLVIKKKVGNIRMGQGLGRKSREDRKKKKKFRNLSFFNLGIKL